MKYVIRVEENEYYQYYDSWDWSCWKKYGDNIDRAVLIDTLNEAIDIKYEIQSKSKKKTSILEVEEAIVHSLVIKKIIEGDVGHSGSSGWSGFNG